VGEPRRRVYCFKDEHAAEIEVNMVSSYELWHKRLGHPSSQALSEFSSTIQKDLVDIKIVCVILSKTNMIVFSC